ncbi:MAG: hypothetical protein RLZZ562_2874 [Planctomycetota bacterium]|jgi:HSP20 family protein
MTLFQQWKRGGRNDPEPRMVAPLEWLRAMERDDTANQALFEGHWMPRADVAETAREYLVTMELPGFDPSEVDVRITDDQLLVRGARAETAESEERRYLRIETSRGAFERSFELPSDALSETEAASAMFRNGVLEIRVPKVQQSAARKVPIRSM